MVFCIDKILSPQGNYIEFFKSEKFIPVLVVGVFHGEEPQGNWLIREYMKENPNTKLMMLPCLNPDGMVLNNRVNSNGVDLNRNFPSKNWELTKKNEFYGGAAPASEIETRFMIDIIEKYNPMLVLSLHAPFKIVNYDGDAIEISKKIAEIMNYPVEDYIGYSTPGSFGTWAGKEKGVPVVTLELDDECKIEDLKAPVFEVFKLLEEYKGY